MVISLIQPASFIDCVQKKYTLDHLQFCTHISTSPVNLVKIGLVHSQIIGFQKINRRNSNKIYIYSCFEVTATSGFRWFSLFNLPAEQAKPSKT